MFSFISISIIAGDADLKAINFGISDGRCKGDFTKFCANPKNSGLPDYINCCSRSVDGIKKSTLPATIEECSKPINNHIFCKLSNGKVTIFKGHSSIDINKLDGHMEKNSFSSKDKADVTNFFLNLTEIKFLGGGAKKAKKDTGELKYPFDYLNDQRTHQR